MNNTKRKKSLASRILHTVVATAVGITSVISAMPNIKTEAFYETYLCGSGTYSVWRFEGLTNDGTSAFCIEPHIHADLNGNYTIDESNASLTQDQQRYMAMAQYYGYPNVSTSNAYYVATQAIIWEIAAKMRNLENYQSTDQSSYFSLKDANKSLKWVAANYSGATTAYNAIVTAMQNYGVNPSFGNTKYDTELTNYTLSYNRTGADGGNYTRTLTDTRGQLDKFDIAAKINKYDGWYAQVIGNDLNVTATKNAVETITVKAENSLSFKQSSYNKSLVTYYNPYNKNGFQKLVTGCKFDPIGFQLKLDKKVGEMNITKTFVDADGNEQAISAVTLADREAVTFQLFYQDGGSEYPVILTKNTSGDYDYSFSTINSSGAGTGIKLNTSTLTAKIDKLPAGTYTLKETACSNNYVADSDKTVVVKNNTLKKTSMTNEHTKPSYDEVRLYKDWITHTDLFIDKNNTEEYILSNEDHQKLNSQIFFTAQITYVEGGTSYTRFLSDAKYLGTRKIGDDTYSVYDANCTNSGTGTVKTSAVSRTEANATFFSLSYARAGIIIKNLPAYTTTDGTKSVVFKEHTVYDCGIGSMTVQDVIDKVDAASSSVKLSENYNQNCGNMSTNNNLDGTSMRMLNNYINHFVCAVNSTGTSAGQITVSMSSKANGTMPNGEKYLKLGFIKRDANGPTISGGKFDLYKGESKQGGVTVYTKLTDEPIPASGGEEPTYFDGEYPVGYSYYVKEVEAPEGFEMTSSAPEYHPITSVARGTGGSSSYKTTMIAELPYKTSFADTIMNQRVYGKIYLHKRDFNDNPIKDVEFGVYAGDKAEGEPIEVLKTDGNGNAATEEDIPLGTYTIKELSAVSPFAICEDTQTVTITKADKEEWGGGHGVYYYRTKEVYFYNKPVECNLNIVKVDDENKPLEGVEFKLYYNKDFKEYDGTEHKAGDIVKAPVTNDNGDIISYTDCILVTNENGKATTNPMQDVDEYGIAQGDAVAVFNLQIGAEYKLVETVPAGYKCVDGETNEDIISYTYEEAQNGAVKEVTKQLTKENVLQKGDLTITKRTEGDVNIEGIVFTLKGTSTAGIKVNKSARTDKNGKVSFTDIPVGRYTVSENGDTVPTCYFVADDQKVTIEDMKETKTTFVNKEKVGTVKIRKLGSDLPNNYEVPLKDIRFTLTGTSDSTRNISMTAVTDKDGYAMFVDVPIGTYTLKEDTTTTPAEYISVVDSTIDITQSERISKSETTFTDYEADNTFVYIRKADCHYGDNSDGYENGTSFVLKGTSDANETISLSDKLSFDGDPFTVKYSVPDGEYTVSAAGENVPYATVKVANNKSVITYNTDLFKDFDAFYTVRNNVKTGNIEVEKHTEGDKNISGVKFTISGTADCGEKVNITVTTDVNGKASVNDVPIGTYTITEDAKSIKYGYLKADDQSIKVEYNKTAKSSFFNEKMKGDVKVVKTSENNKNIANIKFTLTGTSVLGEKISVEATTNAEGIATFDEIDIGTYTLSEQAASVHFAYLSAPNQEVEVQYDKLVTKEFYNELKKGDIEVTKRTEGNLNIKGIKFKLTGTSEAGDEVNIEATTDENGKAYFDDIPIGEYDIEEVESSLHFAYLKADKQSVTVEYDETTETEFYNKEKEGSINVYKRTEGDLNIKGIKFILTGTSDSGRKIYIEAVTDENGKADFGNKIPIGKYTVYEDESTVPYAYLAAAEKTVTITYNNLTEEEFVNEEMKGDVEIIKHTEGDLNIEGITFTLTGTSATGRKISLTAITDENGKAQFGNVPIGTYTVAEDASTVHFAYISAPDKEVEVKYNEITRETFTNEEKKGSIHVVKRSENEKNVKGIKFVLKGTSDSGRKINIKATTDKNGDATFTNIPIGKYVISEDGSTVPTAYLVAEPQNVTVTYAETSNAEFYNELKKGDIEVTKRTEGNLNIKDIKFILSGTSDADDKINIEATTDENGKATFEDIPIGTYTIAEDGKTVPTAYLIAKSQSVTVEYNEKTNADFFNDEKQGSIHIVKRTEGNLNVANVKFNLTGTSDTGRTINRTATTDENGDATFTKLPIGTYTIAEDGTSIHFAYLTATAQDVTVTYNETTETEFYNKEKEGSINVYKRTEGDLNVKGIKFILSGTSDSTRNIRVEAVTDENGKAEFKNIPIGTYQIVEDGETVPYAYLTASAKTVIITYNSTDEQDFYNEEKKGNIEVVKHTEGDVNVANIKFTLSGTSDSGRAIEIKATTNAEGIATFENIPIGTYTITEDGKTVPTGYLVADPQEVTVTYAETTNATFFNDEKEGTIEVTKRSEGNLNISGIKFILTGTSDTGRAIKRTAKTDANGKANFKKIPVGTYTISEDSSSVPYAYLTADEQTVEVFYAETSNVEFFNEEKEGTISLHKRTEGDLNIEGIKFILNGTSESGREIVREAVTDENGNATFTEIPIGTYTITEDNTTTPYAYLTAEPQSVEVFYAETSNVEFFNDEMTGTIEVHKRTEEDKNIEGIKFILTGTSDSGREITREAVTDADGKAEFLDIPIGTYVITEDAETTPYAYLTAEPKNVEVFYAETSDIEFFNEEKTGEIRVVKRTEGDVNVADIEFILTGTSDTGREIEIKATTDETGLATFENIPIGTYTITENGESVPYAYLTAEPQEVEVFYTETTDVTFVNEEKTGSISIKKHTEGEKNIGNITFILSGTSDSGREIYQTATTDENGDATFENVPIGTYTITEDGSTVPAGYLVADAQSVEVFYAETSDVTFINDSTKVEFSKKSITGDDELEGAKLQVLDKNGNVIDEWTSGKETHLIEGVLKAGETYILHEEIAPDGYVIANDVEFTVNDDGKVQTVTMKDDTTKVKISKKAMTGDNELEGAKLQIIDENGKIVEEWTSGTAPHYIEGKLIAGKVYILRETAAPNGYKIANDIQFTVKTDGSVTEVVMKDEASGGGGERVPDTGGSAGVPISIALILFVPIILVFVRKRSKED